jgi:NhaP-type Na+/H+ or K+/H+ antiporter
MASHFLLDFYITENLVTGFEHFKDVISCYFFSFIVYLQLHHIYEVGWLFTRRVSTSIMSLAEGLCLRLCLFRIIQMLTIFFVEDRLIDKCITHFKCGCILNLLC